MTGNGQRPEKPGPVPPEGNADDSIELTGPLEFPTGFLWCESIYLGLPLTLLGWLFFGIAGGLVALVGIVGLLIILWLFVRHLARTGAYLQAHLHNDGLELRPLKSGFLGSKPIAIAWADVARVRLSRMGGGNMKCPHLLIEYLRKKPSRFLRRKLARVRLTCSLWQQPGFMERLRSKVPEERVRVKRPYNVPTLLPRWACAIILFVLSAGMLVSACSFHSEIQENQIPLLLAGPVGLILLFFVSFMGPYFGRRFSSDMFRTAPFAASFVNFPNTGGVFILGIHPLFPAMMGAGLGVVAALAVALALRPREIRWRYVALMHGLALAGFCIGWCTYGGIEGTRVGPGSIPRLNDPWTPSGDGFVTLSGDVSDDFDRGREITWHSADGTVERTVTMPWEVTEPFLGNDGFALLHEDRETDTEQLWHVSRKGGEPKLLDADYQGSGIFGLSQDSRWALAVRYEKDESEEDGMRFAGFCLLDMTEGVLSRTDVDFGKDVKGVVPVSSRTFVVLRGVWAYSEMLSIHDLTNPLPPDLKLDQEGIPFRLEYWDLDQDGAPRILYEDSHPWLWADGFHRMSRIRATRILMDPAPHVEDIALTRDGMAVTETPVPESLVKAERLADTSLFVNRTFDSRYLLGWMDKTARLFVIDRETGRTARLRFGVISFNSPGSPRDHRMLVTRQELAFRPLVWWHPGELPLRSAVYLVDLDQATF